MTDFVSKLKIAAKHAVENMGQDLTDHTDEKFIAALAAPLEIIELRKLVEGLAEQQAMSDDSWRAPFEDIVTRLISKLCKCD